VSRKWKNWYQNEVDEETNGADSRDKVKHNDGAISYFTEDDEGGRARVTTDEERVLLLLLLLLQNLYSPQIQACSSRRRWCRWVGKWTSRGG